MHLDLQIIKMEISKNNDNFLNINKLIYLLDFFEKKTNDGKIDKFEFRNLYKHRL